MAFTLDYADPNTGQPRYNIDQSINAYGGEREDVRLVQVLLNLLYFDCAQGGERNARSFGFEAPEKKRLVEDGWMGEHTATFIEHAWQRMLKNGHDLAELRSAGGQSIDPMRQHHEKSTLMHVSYFLDVLQDYVSNLDVELGLKRFGYLRWDERVNVSLRNQLKYVKHTAAQYEDITA